MKTVFATATCLLLFLLNGNLYAQTVTTEWLKGKWEVTGANFEGMDLDLTSSEALEKSLLKHVSALVEETALTAEDTLEAKRTAEMFLQEFSGLFLDFTANRCTGKMKSDKENINLKAAYRLQGDFLQILPDGKKEWNSARIVWVDANHFSLVIGDETEAKEEDEESSLIFGRKK